MLYNIFHVYDVDGGFGDAVTREKHIGLVEATEEEVKEFLAVWDKPRIYDHPYSDLYEHHVIARPVKIDELSDLQPYDPKTRDWPDLPEGSYSFCAWDGEKWVEPEYENDIWDEGDEE